MKKLLLLFAFLFVTTACSLDGDDHRIDFEIEYLAADSVEVPAYVTPGQTYAIKMYYHRPTDCYYVRGDFYYAISGATRTVAIQAMVIQDSGCKPPLDTNAEVTSFNFQCPLAQANSAASYTFKFYKGDDAYGKQQFIEIEVPVRL